MRKSLHLRYFVFLIFISITLICLGIIFNDHTDPAPFHYDPSLANSESAQSEGYTIAIATKSYLNYAAIILIAAGIILSACVSIYYFKYENRRHE